MASYSHSRLETFQQCRAKYRFTYIDKPDIEPEETIEAFMGSRVHDALEWLYRERQMVRSPKLEDLLATYDETWEREWHEGIRVVRADYSPEDFKNVGREALERYYARYAPFDSGITVGIEQRVQIPVDPEGRYTMVGYVDRLDRVGDGAYEIHDYKTSNTLPEQAKMDADRQLALYQIAVHAMWPDVREVALVWHYLKFDAEIRSTRTPEELERLRRETLELIKSAEACSEFEPKPSTLCDWCEFQALCPARSHLIEIRALPVEEVAQEDGVQLVNSYVKLEQDLADLKREKESLAERIIAFGKTKGLRTIFGQGHLINIWRKETVRFPGAKDPGRAEFEQWLRERGLWEAVSMLSDRKLGTLFEDPSTDTALKAALEEWASPSEVVRLYPKKMDSRGH